MRGLTALLCISCAASATAQSFLASISAYPQLSNFAALIQKSPNATSALLTGSALNPQTVLVPSNAAFASYQARTGVSVGSLAAADLQQFLSYHVLVGSLTTPDLTKPQGLTAPSLLTGEQYDNRTGGAGLASARGGGTASTDGQVVFISSKGAGNVTAGQPASLVESGLGNTVGLTPLDATWDGGKFHMIDGFLTLPLVCTKTIRTNGLSSLDLSLNRTGLSSVLDHIKNVTCLAPSDAAFLAAGSPDTKAPVADLTQALLFHIIPQPLYSNFLSNGQTFQTANNMTVRISLINGAIYFNDAMVVKSNVITNNGLIHQLDRVMSPLSSNLTIGPTTTSSGSTTTAAASGAGTGSTSTSKPTATFVAGSSPGYSPPDRWGITGFLGAAIFFFL